LTQDHTDTNMALLEMVQDLLTRKKNRREI